LSTAKGGIAVNLAALLFDVARRQPDAPAVSDDIHGWSYRQFLDRIGRLAGGLRGRNLQRGDRVMLCMENCAEFLETMFACWTAGLCAVPVNARLHPARSSTSPMTPARGCLSRHRHWPMHWPTRAVDRDIVANCFY
jgi:acyl-CoA synthetase (AMP-forming)/AMP-acid ligase II